MDRMEQLINLVQQFRQERDWQQFHSPKNLAMALMVEAGELTEHFQWLTQAQSLELSPETLQQVEEEMADVLIYLVNMADRLNVDLLEAALAKIEKNRQKYPIEQVRGKADKR